MSDRPTANASQSRGGLLTVLVWIGVGAVTLAGLLVALDSVVGLPFSRTVAIGLGLALGGGLGGITNLFGDGETPETDDETVTLDTESTTSAPQPADLFDSHPDPILYYAQEGHGPVVRAANDAFGTTFDVPPARLEGTPLSEALLVAGENTVDAETVVSGAIDDVVTCETTAGPASFHLRTVGTDNSGYLLYTPVDSADTRA